MWVITAEQEETPDRKCEGRRLRRLTSHLLASVPCSQFKTRAVHKVHDARSGNFVASAADYHRVTFKSRLFPSDKRESS